MNAVNSKSYEVSIETSAGLERRMTVRVPTAEIERAEPSCPRFCISAGMNGRAGPAFSSFDVEQAESKKQRNKQSKSGFHAASGRCLIFSMAQIAG